MFAYPVSRGNLQIAVALGIVVALLSGGCQAAAGTLSATTTASSTATNGAAASASATPGPRATPVKGSGECDLSIIKDEKTMSFRTVVLRYACASSMSDPRVSGREVVDITVTYEPVDSIVGRWEGTMTLTNAGGSWSGKGRGAAVSWSDTLSNYGIDLYVGSGGYAGLTYHEFVTGDNEATQIAGWIEEKG